MERVLGNYGGQITSFEWVFSPRGPDGRPEQLFNRDTGEIYPEVAEAWEKYDISTILRARAAKLRPLLQDKIHLTVGTMDTFHLDEAALLLEETLKETGIRAHINFLPGKDHFNLYDSGLREQIAQEMEETARPPRTKSHSTKSH
jgi:acetyl esterase/lipase